VKVSPWGERGHGGWRSATKRTTLGVALTSKEEVGKKAENDWGGGRYQDYGGDYQAIKS